MVPDVVVRPLAASVTMIFSVYVVPLFSPDTGIDQLVVLPETVV